MRTKQKQEKYVVNMKSKNKFEFMPFSMKV